jgi:aldehyde:ferredoxin oxidoreductase
LSGLIGSTNVGGYIGFRMYSLGIHIIGRKVNLTPMVQEFYHSMGWDEQGRPRPSILQKFDLNL